MPPQGSEEQMNMDFLLPTGFLVAMSCNKNSRLSEVRRQLWKQVLDLPGANLLQGQDSYVFIGITKEAEEEQFEDDCKVKDLPLVWPLLEISVPKATRDAQRLNHEIGELLGFPSRNLDLVQDEEYQCFRRDLAECCREIANRRKTMEDHAHALFFFPPVLDLNTDLPMYIADKISQDKFMMTIRVWTVEERKIPYKVEVSPLSTPTEVVKAAIREKYSRRGMSEAELQAYEEKGGNLYRLKVAGRLEYMLKECLIHSYKYIRDCLSCDTEPDLQLVHKNDVFTDVPSEKNSNYDVTADENIPVSPLQSAGPTTALGPPKLIWDVDHSKSYCIKIHNLGRSRLLLQGVQVCVKAQLFLGTNALSRAITTRDVGWHQAMVFQVPVQNLPRCTQLCLMVCSTENKTDQGHFWVNLQVFDKKRQFRTGRMEYGMWPVSRSLNEQNITIHPAGISGGNPDKDFPVLEIEVMSPSGSTLVYPTDQYINQVSSFPSLRTSLQRKESFDQGNDRGSRDFRLMDTIQNKDPGEELTQNEKSFLWQNRQLCMTFDPNILPRILQSMNWLERHDVVEIYRLVSEWPVDKMSLTTALQLLDVTYPDTRVRSLAVKCLSGVLTDELLILYMMPLVQTLKFDCYMDNPLGRLLLKKALLNWHIGQKFFWHLRSELGNSVSRYLFAPMLERYCRFCGPVRNLLLREVRSLNCAAALSRRLKEKSSDKKVEEVMSDQLRIHETASSLSGLSTGLDQTAVTSDINVESCRVMSSKMRPMWLDWNNADELGEETYQQKIKVIFKQGDDLRQDMLVVTCLKLMDMIWKYSNRDYKLTPYECLAMGEDVGVIEVVQNAATLGSIQTPAGIVAVSDALHCWLHDKNRDRYNEMVKDFSISCAGYCVATFVLGISDRHPDNIMVTELGHVFHIDFGHILNHRKEKFYIKRERVPFVLTDDFIKIISKGQSNFEKTTEWEKFFLQCFMAYIELRRYSHLLISLLKLMMHCDLPELNSRYDLDQIRETLAVGKTEAEAGAFFLGKLQEAYGGQWTTKVDWFFHRLAHSSKS